MRLSRKSILPLLAALLLLCGWGLYWRRGAADPVHLGVREMQLLSAAMLAPSELKQLADSAQHRLTFSRRIREVLAVGRWAEEQGYADRQDVAAQINYCRDAIVGAAYLKRHAGTSIDAGTALRYAQTHAAEFASYLKFNPQLRPASNLPAQNEERVEFGRFKFLADSARREGLEQDEGIRLHLFVERRRLLAANYIDDLMRNPDRLVKDAEIADYFRAYRAQFDEVRLRQILIRTEAASGLIAEEEARQRALMVLARLRRGGDFAQLAREYSDDEQTKGQGGDLGFIVSGRLVQPVEDAAYSLRPGQISDLIRSKIGFHLIKVEDRRSRDLGSDPAIRQQILAKLNEAKLRQHLDQITAESEIKVVEDFQIAAPSS